ncbi:MAG: hypothetical protein Athens101410_469 [Parcubacteria group bacterium Athens1014_10]|nr:MAG: hypothetical protein Athens101410_469 [Parcubacteria group bacterium Athens1014_10]TSD05222.1 MAG: hypothetical protein Athens071412_420 [Parcubacteria group bacterium Athens0714_12]
MSKKDINLLPEDLRGRIKINTPKIKIEKSFELNDPQKSEKFKNDKIELKKTSPTPIFTEIKEVEDIAPLPGKESSREEKTEKKKEFSSENDLKYPEEKTENKGESGKKGVLIISKKKPNIFSKLRLIFSKFEKENFSFKKLFDLTKKKDKRHFHLDVNLIFKENEFLKSKEKEILVKIYLEIIASLFIVFIFYFYLIFLEWKIGDEGKKTEGEILKIEAQINNFKKEEKDLLSIQEKFLYVKDLFEKHIYWTKFFDFLEKYTLSDVYYSKFEYSLDNPLELSGIAKNSETLARQVISLRNASDFIEKLEIKQIDILKEKEVSFVLNIILAPDIFLIKD